jgi:hypothetical protein
MRLLKCPRAAWLLLLASLVAAKLSLADGDRAGDQSDSRYPRSDQQSHRQHGPEHLQEAECKAN